MKAESRGGTQVKKHGETQRSIRICLRIHTVWRDVMKTVDLTVNIVVRMKTVY